MEKDSYYHQRFFRTLYRDMTRRIEQYKRLQQIQNANQRRRREQKFLEEQKRIIRRFIEQEEYAKRKLKEGLNHQQENIESWWKRNVQFRRVRSNCMDRFENLIIFAKKVEEILYKNHFDEQDSQTLVSEIEDEVKTMIHLSDNYEIRRYGEGILAFSQRNRSLIALTIMFLMVSSMAVYTFSNYNIIPKATQTLQVNFTQDDMFASDWAAGEHKSYGFHTMVSSVNQYKSNLKGLTYKVKPIRLYGNTDAYSLEIDKGASELLPNSVRNALGNNIIIEVQALNRGEIVIIILQEGSIILNVRFNQDKVASIGTNSNNFSNGQLEETYHSIRLGIEQRVNTN